MRLGDRATRYEMAASVERRAGLRRLSRLAIAQLRGCDWVLIRPDEVAPGGVSELPDNGNVAVVRARGQLQPRGLRRRPVRG